MEITQLAQYGIAGLALGVLAYVIGLYANQKNTSEAIAEALEPIKELVANNTEALKQLASVTQTIQVSLVKQEARLEELLERARRNE